MSFSSMLTLAEETLLLSFIPSRANLEPLHDRGYHESKISRALLFAPQFTRAEGWALSMYLGPTYYCQGMNQALLGSPMLLEARERFLLMAKAATAALLKLPSLTYSELQNLPQPDPQLPRTSFLKRFVDYSEEVLELYQVGQVQRNLSFTSTTFWSLPIGLLQQYAEPANVVFHIQILPLGSLGKLVDPIKRQAQEGEVLFPPNTRFQVRDRRIENYEIGLGSGFQRQLTVIHLQELQDEDSNE